MCPQAVDSLWGRHTYYWAARRSARWGKIGSVRTVGGQHPLVASEVQQLFGERDGTLRLDRDAWTCIPQQSLAPRQTPTRGRLRVDNRLSCSYLVATVSVALVLAIVELVTGPWRRITREGSQRIE